MEFIPDYKAATRTSRTVFDTYSPAYVVTNEGELRQSMQIMPKKCTNALVVAGSGDHPLFCSLYGAEHVDVFDISYNAKCITDIKVAALNCLKYREYIQFLDDLYMAYDNFKPVTKIAKMNKILYQLPKIEQDYIYSLRTSPLFVRGYRPVTAGTLLTFCEYCNLSRKVTQPYDFYVTNITELANLLTKSYDFMHLSNVFDYVRHGKYKDVILSLMKFVNPGGRIVTQFFDEGLDEIFGFYMAQIVDGYKNWAWYKNRIDLAQNTALKNGVYVLERVR